MQSEAVETAKAAAAVGEDPLPGIEPKALDVVVLSGRGKDRQCALSF